MEEQNPQSYAVSQERNLTQHDAALVVIALRLLAGNYPAFAPQLNRSRNEILKKFQRRGEDDDNDKILAAVRNGYHTTPEIEAVTRIPENTVYKRLRSMEAAMIVHRTRQVTPCRGKGQDNRRALWWLT